MGRKAKPPKKATRLEDYEPGATRAEVLGTLDQVAQAKVESPRSSTRRRRGLPAIIAPLLTK